MSKSLIRRKKLEQYLVVDCFCYSRVWLSYLLVFREVHDLSCRFLGKCPFSTNMIFLLVVSSLHPEGKVSLAVLLASVLLRALASRSELQEPIC